MLSRNRSLKFRALSSLVYEPAVADLRDRTARHGPPQTFEIASCQIQADLGRQLRGGGLHRRVPSIYLRGGLGDTRGVATLNFKTL